MDIPSGVRSVCWDLDFDEFDLQEHADSLLARVLENGCLSDVQWLLGVYGSDRIKLFFEQVAHPLLSESTLCFWRAYFAAEEPWKSLPDWRKNSAAPWVD